MKKLILFFAALCCMVAANAQFIPPHDEIWYTTTDGKIIDIIPEIDDVKIVSNVYKDGKGIIKGSKTFKWIDETPFQLIQNLQTVNLPSTIFGVRGKAFLASYELTTAIFNSSTPPRVFSDIFSNCNSLTKVVVPDGSVEEYKKQLHEVANKIIPLLEYTRNLCLDELNKKKNSISNSEYIAWIDKAIGDINATTSGLDAYDIYEFVLNRIESSELRGPALAAIQAAMQGEDDSEYLNSLISSDIDVINEPANPKGLIKKKEEAIAKLNAAMPAYKAGKAEAFGTLGTQQSGPAVEVTDQNGNVLKLYNPKGVTFVEQK